MKRFIPLLAAALTAGTVPIAARAQDPGATAATANAPDFSQYTTADDLWLHLQQVQAGPKTRPATADEFRAVMANMVTQLIAGSAEFLKRYPTDPRVWDVRLIQIETGSTLASLEGRQNDLEVRGQLQGLASQGGAPSSVRGKARYEMLALSMRAYLRKDPSVTSASILTELQQFIADFPTYPSLDVLKYKVAETLKAYDADSADALLTELADSGEGKIADQARTELATKERLKSPLDLHFTAVDGSDVDLASMRGKVVLVDFWATWCGPCKAELPNVVAAYNKLHSRGFEIVGISLDQDRQSLVTFTAANGMPWPQYFDGKGWQNSISSGFGIQAIPAMWLVNKQGYVVSTNGRADLEGQVEKLLAE
jgi:thiol-disulfide isomerase/thioredoxin